MDLLVPFLVSSTDNRWVAVPVDYATPYAVAMPLMTATAINVVEFALMKVILMHGAPSGLVSDRGRPFVSRVVD